MYPGPPAAVRLRIADRHRTGPPTDIYVAFVGNAEPPDALRQSI